MRYEAGNCTIVISMKNLSDDVLKVDFNVGHIFAKNHTQAKAITMVLFMILGQNSTNSKMDIV